MLKSHESGRGYSPTFMTLWFGEVGGRSQQTTDGANTSAADRNSLAALYVLLIICTWQHVPSWASRHVSCRHLASSWLGPSGRPRPTNQTHHSSVQRPPRGRNTSWNAASSFFYWLKNILNSFIQRWDITTCPELLDAFRVQTCVAAVVNFTPTRRLALLTAQRHSCEVRAAGDCRASGGHDGGEAPHYIKSFNTVKPQFLWFYLFPSQ